MGIWDSELIKEYLHNQDLTLNEKLSIGEGRTPLNIEDILGHSVALKREDHNPSGSHKDRGLAFQISVHLSEGSRDLFISSSGNSAISAVSLLKNRPEQLTVYLSPKISDSKLERLSSILNIPISNGTDCTAENISIRFSQRAVSDAFKASEESGGILLRGSVDPYGWQGYMTIAEEIVPEYPNLTDIFIPSSSGTTAYGIYQGFLLLHKQMDAPLPKFHICQTEAVHSLLDSNNLVGRNSEKYLADSIVDRIGHRKDQIREIIDNTDGKGWVISNNQILKCENELPSELHKISYEGIMALSALKQYLEHSPVNINPVILVTGQR